MDFNIGDKVIYPCHGVAEVTGFAERVIDEREVRVITFSLPQRPRSERSAMTVSVPEDRTEAVGIRPAISMDDADDVLAVLAISDARVPTNWSRRFKNHQEKLRSGDVFLCAEVVRNLARRQLTSTLAAAERAMYDSARHLLLSELAVSWDIDPDEAEARIDDALALTTPV